MCNRFNVEGEDEDCATVNYLRDRIEELEIEVIEKQSKIDVYVEDIVAMQSNMTDYENDIQELSDKAEELERRLELLQGELAIAWGLK